MTSFINASTSSGVVTTADTSGSLALQTASTTALTLDTSQNATFAGSVKTNTLTSAASTALTLQSAGTTAVTIDTSQRVGIGTASPSNILDIVSASNPTIRITDTTNNCYTELNATDTVGYVGTASNHAFAFTTNNTERMRIDSSGNLLVGTTSLINNSRLTVKATGANGVIGTQVATNGVAAIDFLNAAGGEQGYIVVNAGSVQYLSVSDYRLKENIAPIANALSKVAELKPVTYKWKADGTNAQGFIAHELQAVVPDCVSGAKDEVDADGNPKYQGIDTSFLVATLTAAIQEAKALIDTQAETINALTARIVALEK